MASSTTPTVQLPLPFCNKSADQPTLLTQGAEALVYRATFLTPNTPIALKYRPPKAWRHPTLDRRLTRARLLAEARTLTKCRREGVAVPAVLGADWDAGWIALEWVDGATVRACLDRWLTPEAGARVAAGREPGEDEELWGLMRRVGAAVGRLHGIGVIHGDLTTSNLMLRPPREGRANGAAEGRQEEEQQLASLAGDVVLIDLGLSTQTVQDEDRAVDLYVLERAFASTHPAAEPLFQEALRAYGESFKGARVVLKRLDDVRLRGRKRSMLG